MVPRPAPARRLQGRLRHPRPDRLPKRRQRGARTMVVGVANAGGVLPHHWIARDRRGARRRPRRRERPACPARDGSGDRRSSAAASPAAVRRPPLGHDLRHRQGHQAAGPAAADRRHRLLGRQEIHRAGARARNDGARLQGRVPRHRPDRHPHLGPRRRHRCGGRRLHLRRCRMAHPRQRSRPLGRGRGPGLAVPPVFRRRDARAAAWRAARCLRRLP